jgi:hypothetical protein
MPPCRVRGWQLHAEVLALGRSDDEIHLEQLKKALRKLGDALG